MSVLKPSFYSERHKHKRKHTNLRKVKTNAGISIRLIPMFVLARILMLGSDPFSLDINAVMFSRMLMLLICR